MRKDISVKYKSEAILWQAISIKNKFRCTSHTYALNVRPKLGPTSEIETYVRNSEIDHVTSHLYYLRLNLQMRKSVWLFDNHDRKHEHK